MADSQTTPRLFTCHHCGANFTGRKRKYCGDDCMRAATQPAPVLHGPMTCAQCGNQFYGRKRKFCSDDCARKAKNRRSYMRRRNGARLFKSIRRPNPIINGFRECLDCGQTLPLSAYPVKVDPKCKSGQTIRGVCKSCEQIADTNRSRKRTPEQRIEERRKAAKRKGRTYTPSGKAWQKTPFDVLQSRVAKDNAKQAWRWWLTKAPDDWMQSYYDALGEPSRNPRLTEAERYRIRYSIDPSFAIKERIRRQVTKAEKRDGVGELLRGALRRGGQSPMAEKLLGYGIDDLRSHLERQFNRGMNWDRFMAGEIHIDHIIPQSHFDMRDESQWRKCWCLSNLQPLWARDNLEKRDRVLYLV